MSFGQDNDVVNTFTPDRSAASAWIISSFFGEAHLRRILRSYTRYYNDIRTHRSLEKDAPAVRPVQQTGFLRSRAILGGLHHQYCRI